MKKCIVIPDSFKGTMTSLEVCQIIRKSIKKEFPNCDVLSIPVADGGEGTVDCFLTSMQGEKIYVTVKDAFGKDKKSFYGIIGTTAIVEVAAVAGMAEYKDLNPLIASTFGVGQLIRDAVNKGCRKIVLGLGGSCTNDAGAGMAAALGSVFYDKEGRSFIPTGGTLSKVSKINNSSTEQFLKDIEIQCMCDINNVMYGDNGAACVFAPQKGANKQEVDYLDKNLREFAKTIKKEVNIDVSEVKGGGAAGAMGAGAYAFLNAELLQGIDVVLDLINFESLLDSCEYIFTGEGKLDIQSLSGKVVIGVGKRACKYQIPVIAIVGMMDILPEDVYAEGISQVYVISKEKQSIERLQKSCRDDLSATMGKVLKNIKSAEV